jgi:hypothetical protein
MQMRAKTITAAAITIAVAIAMVFIYTNSFAVKQRVASLANVKGTVTVKKAGTTQWIPAADRMELAEGDQLRSEGGSAAILKMDDGSMVKLGPLATMTVKSLSSVGKGNKTSLDVSVGKTWSRVRKLSGDSDFNVSTPTAVAGVRGTYFSAEVEQTSSSTFDVFDGSVAVSSASNPDQSVMVASSQRTTVAPNQKPSAPTKIPASEENAGRKGFSDEEFTAATFDLQISVNPQVVEPGQNATVTLQVYRNGQPYRAEAKIKLSLTGAAVFTGTGTSEIETTTDDNGVLALEITSPEKETVTVSAQLTVKTVK